MPASYEPAVAALDRLVLLGLADHLHRHGGWPRPGPADQPAAAEPTVLPRFRWIPEHWAAQLTAHGVTTRPGRAELVAARRGLDDARRTLGYGPELADLLLRSLRLLPELLAGTVGVQALLYPDGDLATAEVAYRTNAASAWLNAHAARAAAETAARAGRPLEVLELGGGVGATTAELLPAVAAQGLARYRFTDVSPFFLDLARRRFTGTSVGDTAPLDTALFDTALLDTALLDIDDLASVAAAEPGGVDLVVAATMAHNARDVDAFLAAVAALLRPGGRLILVEPVVEHPQSLTTMPFALSGPDGPPVRRDLRAGTRRTYLSLDEWSAALAGAGLRIEKTLPPPGHPLSAFSQHLVVAAPASPEGAP
ncbi:MAG: class I SAM-dependent methyltransferase [Actinomycetales bacterium]